VKFFNEFVEIAKTRNRLPHWQQDGSTYFVTFRLNDSIPKVLMDKWTANRNRWMLNHPQPWDEETEMEYHRLFSAEMDLMLDAGHGECVLRKREHAEIVREELGKHDGVRYMLHAYAVMPNHAHLLFSVTEGVALDKVVGSWKRNSARRINESLGQRGALWQKDYFDRIIRSWEHILRVARYVRRNPTKAKLREGEYLLYEAEWVRKMLG
jgi:REP element-mobilizing transposase RayT